MSVRNAASQRKSRKSDAISCADDDYFVERSPSVCDTDVMYWGTQRKSTAQTRRSFGQPPANLEESETPPPPPVDCAPARSPASSVSEGKRTLDTRKSCLRMGTHRLSTKDVEMNTVQIQSTEVPVIVLVDPVPEPSQLKAIEAPVKRDILGLSPYTPQYIPHDREPVFKPAHVNRESVFKEDFQKIKTSEDLQELLAVFSMALDLDAHLNNTRLMLATRHEIQALKKQLRKVLKARIDLAVKDDNLADLTTLFDEINKDRLMKSLAKFPEVYCGLAYLRLRRAHDAVEEARSRDRNVPDETRVMLEKAVRRAKRVNALKDQVAASQDLIRWERIAVGLPPLDEELTAPSSNPPSPLRASSPQSTREAKTKELRESESLVVQVQTTSRKSKASKLAPRSVGNGSQELRQTGAPQMARNEQVPADTPIQKEALRTSDSSGSLFADEEDVEDDEDVEDEENVPADTRSSGSLLSDEEVGEDVEDESDAGDRSLSADQRSSTGSLFG